MDGWMVGCSLNTGVNTGHVSTSNAPKITEGGGEGLASLFWSSFFLSLFSILSFTPYPTYFLPNPALFPFSLMYGCSRFVCFCNWQRSDGLCQWQHMACVSDMDYCVMFLTVCVWLTDSDVHSLLGVSCPSGWEVFFFLSSFLNDNEVSRLF